PLAGTVRVEWLSDVEDQAWVDLRLHGANRACPRRDLLDRPLDLLEPVLVDEVSLIQHDDRCPFELPLEQEARLPVHLELLRVDDADDAIQPEGALELWHQE